MILKNDFYTISDVTLSAGHPCYVLRLHADHTIFRAHFPGRPITPGVCIVQIAKELLEEHLGRTLRVCAVKNVKFLSVLTPEDGVGVTYRFDRILQSATDGTVRVQVSVSAGEEAKAKLSFTCVTVA